MFNEIVKDVREISEAVAPHMTPQDELKHLASNVVEAAHACAAGTTWETACALADIVAQCACIAGLIGVDLDKAFDHRMHVKASRAGITMPRADGTTIASLSCGHQ